MPKIALTYVSQSHRRYSGYCHIAPRKLKVNALLSNLVLFFSYTTFNNRHAPSLITNLLVSHPGGSLLLYLLTRVDMFRIRHLLALLATVPSGATIAASLRWYSDLIWTFRIVTGLGGPVALVALEGGWIFPLH